MLRAKRGPAARNLGTTDSCLGAPRPESGVRVDLGRDPQGRLSCTALHPAVSRGFATLGPGEPSSVHRRCQPAGIESERKRGSETSGDEPGGQQAARGAAGGLQ